MTGGSKEGTKKSAPTEEVRLPHLLCSPLMACMMSGWPSQQGTTPILKDADTISKSSSRL